LRLRKTYTMTKTRSTSTTMLTASDRSPLVEPPPLVAPLATKYATVTKAVIERAAPRM